MLQVSALFILVLVIPFMFRDFRRSLTQSAVFEGLKPSVEKMEGLGERTNTRYCWFDIPALADRLVAEISIERYNKLKAEELTPATVVVTFLPLCRPKISHLLWQDEKSLEEADKTPKGVFAGVLYFMAGLCFIAWALSFQAGSVSLVTGYMSLAFLILSGYALMMAQTAGMSREVIRKSDIRLLGLISIGRGKVAFLLLAIICFAGSLYLFSHLSLLAIILGLNTSMAAGSFAYLALKA